MQLKNVIFDVSSSRLPQIKYTVNPREYTPQDTVVVCDTNEKIEKWKGYACIGIEGGEHIRTDYVADSLTGIDEEYLLLAFCRFHCLPMTICETRRLFIREMSADDLPALYEIYRGSVLRFVEPLYGYEEELAFTESYIKNMYGFYGYGLWLLVRKEDGAIIGRAGLSNRLFDGKNELELGYVVGEEYQGKGYATEACEAILRTAYEKFGADRVVACIEKENVPSVRLAHKLNFSKSDKEWDSGLDVYIHYCPFTEST